MIIINSYLKFLSNVKINRFLLCLKPCVFISLYLLIFIFAKIKRIKKPFDKSTVIMIDNALNYPVFVYSVALLTIRENNNLTLEFLSLYLILELISNFMKILIKLSDKKNIRNNRRIDRLNNKNSIINENVVYTSFDYVPKDKEYLLTSKMLTKSSICLDYSMVNKYIKRLKKHDLNCFDLDEIEKLEIDLYKFQNKNLSDFERQIFSDRLLYLVKLVVKYSAY